MFLLSRLQPLIINLPDLEEASQDFFAAKLCEQEAAYLEALIIADRLANVPAIEASDISTFAAVSASDVIISYCQTELEQWVDQYSEGEVYWFFSLRNGKASPLKQKYGSVLNSPAFVPNVQISSFFKGLDAAKDALRRDSIDSSCEAPEKPTARLNYFVSLHQLFHCVSVSDIKDIINTFLEDVSDDSIYIDPVQRASIAKAISEHQEIKG